MTDIAREKIMEAWGKVVEKYDPRLLTEDERNRFAKLLASEELARNMNFVLGEPLVRCIA